MLTAFLPLAGSILVAAGSDPIKDQEVICTILHVPPPGKKDSDAAKDKQETKEEP
jgi:hypothetical protein